MEVHADKAQKLVVCWTIAILAKVLTKVCFPYI